MTIDKYSPRRLRGHVRTKGELKAIDANENRYVCTLCGRTRRMIYKQRRLLKGKWFSPFSAPVFNPHRNIYIWQFIRKYEPRKESNKVCLHTFLHDLALYQFKLPDHLEGYLDIPMILVNNVADKIEQESKNWPDGSVTICRSKDDVSALCNETYGKIHYCDQGRNMVCNCMSLTFAPSRDMTSITEQLYIKLLSTWPINQMK